MFMKEFKAFYEKNKLMDSYKDDHDFLIMLDQKFSLDKASKETIDDLGHFLIDHKLNDPKHYMILMRYYKASHQDQTYIYLTQFTGGLGVFESMLKRLKSLYPDIYTRIIKKVYMPVLGHNPKILSQYTKSFMKVLESHLDETNMKKVLTGNNHQIPESSQVNEKIAYESAESFEAYLKDRHQRKVKELQYHMDHKLIWFEQDINQDVIDYVKANQEILSGRIEGDALYITKIPYDTLAFLHAGSLKEKQYYACHCPFARESIKDHKKVHQRFCYCSAGFAKFPFEVILGQKLKVEVIETALGKDPQCRFRIDLKDVVYKK